MFKNADKLLENLEFKKNEESKYKSIAWFLRALIVMIYISMQ